MTKIIGDFPPKDILGRVLELNDKVAYAALVTKHAFLRFGKVIGIDTKWRKGRTVQVLADTGGRKYWKDPSNMLKVR